MKKQSGEAKGYKSHIVAVPYPSQGHLNPMLQLCKRLVSKHVKTTLALTKFLFNSTNPKSHAISFATISDGFDAGGFAHATSVSDYLRRMETVGSKTLEQLIKRSNDPIDCIVYDAFLPWVAEVANKWGIKAAPLFTQSCAVNWIYYHVQCGGLKLPLSTSTVELPGLPLIQLVDMPSFVSVYGSYPAYFHMVLNQFSNLDKAHFLLINTFYKLEQKAVESMSKVYPLLTIGPTVPSTFLDNRIANDHTYDISLFQSDSLSTIINWLHTKPPRSVVYVAFGSMCDLSSQQMEEIAWGLRRSDFHFLWVAKASDKDTMIPKDFIEWSHDKGLIANWSPQLEVLSNEAIGCFLSHGGWNSTTEALSLGVPMVVMPQWTDQTTCAKLVQDGWGIGVRAKTEMSGVVTREEVERCIREVMEGETGAEMKQNASKWRDLAKEAVSEGGTSDVNIDTFISSLCVL